MYEYIASGVITLLVVGVGWAAYRKGREDGCPEGGPGKEQTYIPPSPPGGIEEPLPFNPGDFHIQDRTMQDLEKGMVLVD